MFLTSEDFQPQNVFIFFLFSMKHQWLQLVQTLIIGDISLFHKG